MPQILALKKGRVHEVSGPGAVGFAAWQLAARDRPAIWLHLSWEDRSLCPPAIGGRNAARLVMVRVDSEADLLWATEEALRSGAAPLVIAQPASPLSLTAGRRLQLAAEAGRAVGLLTVREGHGSPAAETRWHCRPVWHPQDSTCAEWVLNKNKSGTLDRWTVTFDAAQGTLRVVSTTGERSGAAPQALPRSVRPGSEHR
ncbi:MAG: hypothetical protein KDE00_03685 [Rhodobacteraceae bacterium]|nr:hypothetical protein [Paracoccaceae bacterium]